eukprot:gene8933-9856_t
MAARNDDSLLFVVEWYDPLPQMKKQYLLKYFPDQQMAEMIDFKSKKIFLKKSPCPPHLTREDFFVGGKVVLYSRDLDIIDYGDLKTKERLDKQCQPALFLLPATTYSEWGKILNVVQQELQIVQLQTFLISPNEVDRLGQILEVSSSSLRPLTDGVALGVLVQGEDGINRAGGLEKKFKQQQGLTFWVSQNVYQTSALQGIVLDPRQGGVTATLDSCTCCLIKPHAVKAKQVGVIIDEIISQGYEISAARSLLFDKSQAEEFYEVYKGVVPEYGDHVIQLATGLSIALELRAQQAVETFRVTAGPWDIDLAKELRPNSLRAKYGIDRILNAVHCTDLPEDGALECEYCFKIL